MQGIIELYVYLQLASYTYDWYGKSQICFEYTIQIPPPRFISVYAFEIRNNITILGNENFYSSPYTNVLVRPAWSCMKGTCMHIIVYGGGIPKGAEVSVLHTQIVKFTLPPIPLGPHR